MVDILTPLKPNKFSHTHNATQRNTEKEQKHNKDDKLILFN